MISALSATLLPFLAAALAPLIGRVSGRLLSWFAAGLSLALFLLLLPWVPAVQGGPVLQTISWVPSLGVDLSFRIDGFSLLFALLITGIGTLVIIYTSAYMAGDSDQPRFLAYILGFMGSMLGLVLSDNLIVLFVFWELTSFFSFLLIGFNGESKKARQAAVQSLMITVAGGLALFAGILMLGFTSGSFSLTALLNDPAPVLNSPLMPAIIICIFAGCFTKSAQFPFHFWLPNAMEAPTPASAYLHSATMVKAGVYLLLRLDPAFGSEAIWIWPLVAFGSATMVAAGIQSLRFTEFKAVLAYSTVVALGTLVLLAGLDDPTASIAAIGFILAHAFYKAALFFVAGTAIRAVGTKDIAKMGGLARYLPFTATAAVLAGLSMAGLPPFGGFIAKELLFEAKLTNGWLILALSVGVFVNAAVVAIAFVTALRPFFLKPQIPLEKVIPESPGMYIGPIVLAGLGAAMGLAPELFNATLLLPAATAIFGTQVEGYFKLWHGLTPMLAMSALAVALGGALAWKWEAVHRRMAAISALDLLSPQGLYDRSMAGILQLGERITRILQNGQLRVYALFVFIVSGVTLGVGLIASGGPALPDMSAPDDDYAWVFAGLLVAGSLAAALSKNLMASLLAIGLVGYAVAVLLLTNGAPDLAFTQFAVETLFVVIVTAVLLKMPMNAPDPRSRDQRLLDAAVALGVGTATTFVALSALALPFDGSISDFFGAVALSEANGRNVVNVILVDFRALDTLGEIAVVAFAAFAAWGLLRVRRTTEK